MRIYLDNAATTKVDSAVVDAMRPFQEIHFGNASSLHRPGVEAAKGIERAREILAEAINADPREIVFTSGGTESNNLALKGAAAASGKKGGHIVTSRIEHPSILETTAWLEKSGFRITRLPVDPEGFVDPEELERTIGEETILVSIMHANNEIGTIQPIEALGAICRKREVLFHTDACQSFTKAELDVEKQHLAMASLSAHKAHGPKGVGALYLREGVTIEPLLHGGGHEDDTRSGTYNTAGIVGFGKAVAISEKKDAIKMADLRDHLIRELQGRLAEFKLNGPTERRLCNNIHLTIRGVDAKGLLSELDKRGVAVSTGSACASAKLTPSHVLTAIGLSPEETFESIRIGLSKWTTKEEIDFSIGSLIDLVQKERARE